MLFTVNTWVLFLLILAVVGGFDLLGVAVGRRLSSRAATLPESIGVVQGTLLGLVGLLLAFGLSMSVTRYEDRRAKVVDEANTIGTTWLRAQMLPEPQRTASLALLQDYGTAAVDLADRVPDSASFDAASARAEALQRDLWAQAGQAVDRDPLGTAPRLYTETLNDMIDAHTSRLESLRNRVPTSVGVLLLVGSAAALGVLSLYLTVLSRTVYTPLVAAVFVTCILLVSFDLDRPHRGFIAVPSTALVEARRAMDDPPAHTPQGAPAPGAPTTTLSR
jgi:hypothetical protein